MVADEGGTLVFVEVRSCHSEHLELAENSIDWKKQKKLHQVASFYLKEKNIVNCPCRFDAVIISFTQQEGHLQVEEIKHLLNIITGF